MFVLFIYFLLVYQTRTRTRSVCIRPVPAPVPVPVPVPVTSGIHFSFIQCGCVCVCVCVSVWFSSQRNDFIPFFSILCTGCVSSQYLYNPCPPLQILPLNIYI
jgi:hypothetical protein